MKRIVCAALLAAVVLAVVVVRAAGGGLAGNWTVQLFQQGTELTYWVAKLQDQDGKLTGTVEIADGEPPATLHDVRVDGDLLSFNIKERAKQGHLIYAFQGKIPHGGGRKIMGSIAVGPVLLPARLERTSLTDLKGREKAKEWTAKPPQEKLNADTLKELRDDPFMFAAAEFMFRKAATNKAEPAQVGTWYNIVSGAAAAYGPRWQHQVALRTAETLAHEKGYAAVAEQAARQVLDLGDTKMDSDTKIRAMTALATALKLEGKEDYANVAVSLEALEREAYKEHSKHALPFTPDKFGGRKDKGDRAVLVELFTGAQCPPCVAADLAFDGLGKTYRPKEVVLLQYHLHIPGPDPLTNPGTLARLKYYGDAVEGTPTIFFNGKAEAGGGGFVANAEEKYAEYRKVIDPLLEKPASVKLEATAVRKGDTIHITATASGVDKPGDNIRLRLALTEEWVRYRGGNGLSYHHHIVRDLPGGAEGLPLTRETGKQEATVDLDVLRTSLATYLEEFARQQSAKNRASFPTTLWPLGLRDLRVVAFVQNDETKEVLQAVEVSVR